jgi:glycosyltransferase involved in cell wall biosynthesis
MNQSVVKSEILNNNFDLFVISISYKSKIEDIRILSLKKIYIIIKLTLKLILFLCKHKPSFIYFQISPLGTAFFRDCLYLFVMKLFRVHVLLHLHGKGIKDHIIHSRFRQDIYRWAFRKNSIICLAESLKHDILDVYDETPYVVNNGIPFFPPGLISHQNENNDLQILFLSNLLISKGIYDFLDAMAIVIQKGIKVKAIIVGEEVEIKSGDLMGEILKRHIDHYVRFLGPLYDSEKIKVYGKTYILVYPTINDVWGLVILEAMQAGIPVIATREGAIPEIVDDGTTGFLVDKHRPDQIAQKLEILIQDPKLRKNMGDAARSKFLEKYTVEVFENNLKSVFTAVHEKSAKSGSNRLMNEI